MDGYYQLGLGVTTELALQLLQLSCLEYSTSTTQCINLQNLLTQNSNSSPQSEPVESSPKLEEPPVRVTHPTTLFPYQWIASSQRRTPSPALLTTHPSPISTTRLFCPSTPPFLFQPMENLQSIITDPSKPLPEGTSVFPEPTPSYIRATSEE